MPKELLTIVDKPLIQYAAEEAVAAGIDTLIFVTGRNKRAVEDHFDNNQELESALRSKGHNLKAPVTGNPKAGSRAAGRKKSFCARMGGVSGAMSKNGKPTRKALALRKWNCN